LLSDSRQRREFDQAQRFGGDPRGGKYSGGGFGVPDPHDDFFGSSFHRSHPFHDPFEVFERVFREEFGAARGQGGPRAPFSAFDDDFFGRPMMDPFGGGGMMGGGFPSLFGGGLFGGGFPGGMGGQRGGHMRDPIDEMFESMPQQQANSNSRAGNYSTKTVTSSSSTFGGGGGNRGESVTTQTTTRIVNGERQTVTERIVRRADGTVERQVLEDTTGGGARLTNGSSQQAEPAAALPAPPTRRRRSETKPAETSRRRRQSSDKRQRPLDDDH
jgi:hypothetical protein